MGSIEVAEEISDYDEVDESMIFGGGGSPAASRSSGGFESVGRRKGKKSLSPAYTGSRKGRQSRKMKGGFGFNARRFMPEVNSLLLVSILGVLSCAAILFVTFGTKMMVNNQFYGSLVAAMIVVGLLFYLAAQFFGGGQ